MNISKNTWHYRAFNFWFTQKRNYSVEEYEARWDNEVVSNLCPYVRVILLWAPLRFLFSSPRVWGTLAAMLAGAAGFIYRFKGVYGLEILGAILAYIAVLSLFLSAAVWTTGKIQEQWRKHPHTAITDFTEVLSERVKAAHDGICPIIHFVDDGEK